MLCMSRVGENHIFIRIYGVHTVFLAGKSPYIRSHTVCIYGSAKLYTQPHFLLTPALQRCCFSQQSGTANTGDEKFWKWCGFFMWWPQPEQMVRELPGFMQKFTTIERRTLPVFDAVKQCSSCRFTQLLSMHTHRHNRAWMPASLS